MPLQPEADGIVDFNSHEAIPCYYCAAFNTITIIFLQYYLLKLRIIRNWIENIHKWKRKQKIRFCLAKQSHNK